MPFLFVLSFWACQSHDVQSPSTQAMVSHLQAKADTAYQSGSYPYFTDKMLQKLSQGIQQMPPSQRASRILDYALVLILKGDNTSSIDEIEKHLKGINNFQQVNRSNHLFFSRTSPGTSSRSRATKLHPPSWQSILYCSLSRRRDSPDENPC